MTSDRQSIVVLNIQDDVSSPTSPPITASTALSFAETGEADGRASESRAPQHDNISSASPQDIAPPTSIDKPDKSRDDGEHETDQEEYPANNNSSGGCNFRRILRSLVFYGWLPYNPRDPILRRSIWFDLIATLLLLFVPWLVGGVLLGLFYTAPAPGPNTRTLTPDQKIIIERIVWIPNVLSTVGSLVIIVLYIILRIFRVKRGTGIHMRLILFLSIADLVFDLSIYPVIFFPENWTICYIQAGFSQWGPMCSCLWTFCIAFTLYQNLIKNRPQKELARVQIVYHILSWGMPTLFAILLLALQMPSHQLGWCWIDNRFAPWRFLFFYLFLAIIFMYNLAIYCIIVVFATKSYLETRRYSGVPNSGGSRNVMRKQTALLSVRLAWFLLAFFFTWIWGLTNRVLNLFVADQFFVLIALHTFFTPFQGFLNMLAYGAGFRGGVWKFIKDKTKSLIMRIRKSK